MEIGATKAVQDRLKTTKIEESKGASLVFLGISHFLHHDMNHTEDIHCIVIPVSWFNICHCYCITITGIYNKQDISSFYCSSH